MAFFMQSERDTLTRDESQLFVYAAADPKRGGQTEVRPLWPGDLSPKRILLTGGASCPDGLIQQVITRLNSLWPAEALRSIDEVLIELEADV